MVQRRRLTSIAEVAVRGLNKEVFNADAQKAITDLPLVVLVNRSTAGAAELLAAAILENMRGDVVGDKTYGVGSVQKLIEIPDGSALILSVAKYYSPSGKAIQDNAVTPSVMAGTKEDEADISEEDGVAPGRPKGEAASKDKEDEQLEKAIEVVKKRAAKAA